MRILNLFLIFLFLFSINSCSLPKCVGTDTRKWEKCSGQGTKIIDTGSEIYEWADYILDTGEIKNGSKIKSEDYILGRTGDHYFRLLHPFCTMDNVRIYYSGEWTGSWREGKYHGKGVLSLGKWQKYKGEFKHGEPHGQGTIHTKYGEYSGNWENGSFHGEGVYKFPSVPLNQSEAMKPYTNNLRASGSLSLSLFKEYQGNFVNGSPSGQGILFYKDGSRYEGEFRGSSFHGKGKIFFPDGESYTGIFGRDQAIRADHGLNKENLKKFYKYLSLQECVL